MKALCREYLRSVLLVGGLLGGSVLALEIPGAVDALRWTLGGLDTLMAASRWGTIAGVVLVLAAGLTAAEWAERRAGGANDTTGTDAGSRVAD